MSKSGSYTSESSYQRSHGGHSRGTVFRTDTRWYNSERLFQVELDPVVVISGQVQSGKSMKVELDGLNDRIDHFRTVHFYTSISWNRSLQPMTVSKDRPLSFLAIHF